MRVRKKPIEVEAHQWTQDGDHSAVRRYRHPEVSDVSHCGVCGLRMGTHGWIDTLEGGHVVCPRDYIITGVRGEHYPCKPGIFEQTYEPADGPTGPEARYWCDGGCLGFTEHEWRGCDFVCGSCHYISLSAEVPR